MFGSSLSLFKVNIVAFKYLSKQWHLLSVQARKKTNRLIIPGIINGQLAPGHCDHNVQSRNEIHYSKYFALQYFLSLVIKSIYPVLQINIRSGIRATKEGPFKKFLCVGGISACARYSPCGRALGGWCARFSALVIYQLRFEL